MQDAALHLPLQLPRAAATEDEAIPAYPQACLRHLRLPQGQIGRQAVLRGRKVSQSHEVRGEGQVFDEGVRSPQRVIRRRRGDEAEGKVQPPEAAGVLHEAGSERAFPVGNQ